MVTYKIRISGKLSTEIYLNCLKMQWALLLADKSNFNHKNIKIITNSALAKAGPEFFFRLEENF